ncbi:hypothetical protein [Shimia sp. MMG029]|uniref:hypothetical protein n=1 Tax=Shimia sp. MMG029 TaxID=3021978 RepID=UPI0022FF0928|nr:hypothetical protein [Shimia sp. MMG029]MDA5556082.1 hypothetical protein [Shimia sp. MMG029]
MILPPFSPASSLLVQATTQRVAIDDGQVSAQQNHVSVKTTEKPRLGSGIGEMIFGPEGSSAPDNSRIANQFLNKAIDMAKALARLQGSSVQAVIGNLPGGGIMQASNGWGYTAEIEIYHSGAIRMSSQLTGTSGDDNLTINTGDASQKDVTRMSPMPFGIDAGDGNDALSLASQRVMNVDGGKGDDRVAIDAMLVTNIDGGEGADAIAIVSSEVYNVEGGAGADAISIAAHNISNVYGGAGNDAVTIQGDHVFNVSGGGGSDAISVSAKVAQNVEGGEGSDLLTVNAQQYAHIRGGAGNDVINARASGNDGFLNVSGGTGNDLINIDADMALLRFEGGDGKDQVQIKRTRDLTVSLGTADLDGAKISFDEDSLKIVLEDGAEITVNGLKHTTSIRVISDHNSGIDLRSHKPLDIVI